jgi:hypothetical protein
MKPFNLQAALAGKPVVTRDGRPVKIAGYNEDSENLYWRLIGWINGTPSWWSLLGKAGTGDESSYDLFMATTTRKEWIVRRLRPSGAIASRVFTTKAMAEYSAFQYQGATIHEITITE